MRNLRPELRVIIGRNIILTMGALYSLRQALYYATTPPVALSEAQGILTADGGALGAWATLWALAAALCVADMVNRHTRHGLSALVGITFAWGIGYLLIWALSGFIDYTLLNSAIGWLAPAVFIFGFLLKVTALQDMLRSRGTSD